jgi:hypothetical protein
MCLCFVNVLLQFTLLSFTEIQYSMLPKCQGQAFYTGDFKYSVVGLMWGLVDPRVCTFIDVTSR